jgi:hypothetical protein
MEATVGLKVSSWENMNVKELPRTFQVCFQELFFHDANLVIAGFLKNTKAKAEAGVPRPEV